MSGARRGAGWVALAMLGTFVCIGAASTAVAAGGPKAELKKVVEQFPFRANDYYLSACIECGCCSFVCPANIEITGYIKTGKILQARAKKRLG